MKKILGLFRHWGKIILFAWCVLIFTLVLFPLDDLGDLASSFVAKMTGNNVYLRFDRMGLTVAPQPGVQFKQVHVETNTMPAVSVAEMTLTPSLSALIHKQPYGHFKAKGFMKGQVSVELSPGKRTEDGRQRFMLNVDASKLNVYDIRELTNLPLLVRGQLNLNIKEAQIDPVFKEQPEADVSVQIDKFELPASNVATQIGPITLPDLKLGQIALNGRVSGGRLNITSGTIGKPGDEVEGSIKGNLGISIQNNNGVFTPIIGGYSVELDLKIQKSFEDKASLFLSFLESYRVQTPQGSRYRFKLSAANLQNPPSMEAMR